jgi:3-oxoacyl-[acyl-carrier protein] reductase
MAEPGIMSLKGKKVLVTGANQGLGLAISKAFLAEEADLLLGARGLEKLSEVGFSLRAGAKPGQRVEWQALDVSDPVSARSFALKADSLWGRVDTLINNAGVYGPKGRVEENDWQAWQEAISINLMGTVLMCRECLPLLRKSQAGRVINLSGGGATSPLPRLSAYAASKAAVVRFTETLAEELKEERIGVYAVAPGALNTRLLDEVLEAGEEKVGKDFYARARRQKSEGGAPLEAGASLCIKLAGPGGEGLSGKLLSAVWDPWDRIEAHRQELAASEVYTLRRIVPKDRGMDW